MANKFVSSAGPKGTGDGSSETNAWGLAGALANAAAGDYVWIKNDGVYLHSFTVGCSGSATGNTHIFFIGYNDISNCDLVNHISDMDFGRPFWGGPLNPNAANCWVSIESSSTNTVFQSGKNNIHWRNIYFRNSNMAVGYYAYNMKNSQNCSFTKCKFEHSDINLWVDSSSTNCLISYCYFSDYVSSNLEIGSGSYLNMFSHCVFNGGAVKMFIVFNNTMYNQTSFCLGYGHDSYAGGLIEYNNIFVPAAKNIPAICRNGNGSIAYSGYGCAYSIADNSVLDTPYSGENGLNVNPQFVNAASSDFRPKNSLVLQGGMPDFSGNPGQIGAVLQKYQFVKRWQAANPGRVSIFK